MSEAVLLLSDFDDPTSCPVVRCNKTHVWIRFQNANLCYRLTDGIRMDQQDNLGVYRISFSDSRTTPAIVQAHKDAVATMEAAVTRRRQTRRENAARRAQLEVLEVQAVDLIKGWLFEEEIEDIPTVELRRLKSERATILRELSGEKDAEE